MDSLVKAKAISFEEELKSKIYTVRGMQVMLDSDLADLYEIDTKTLNRAVKRNISRFPVKFMFQMNEQDFNSLRYQFGTLKNSRGAHRKYFPYAFNEQGIAMLSAVLKSPTAIEISIKIIDAFVEMRRFLSTNGDLFNKIVQIESNLFSYKISTDERFKEVFNALERNELPKQGVFYNGQVFDAHKLTSELIRRAIDSIVLIDNYIDDNVLTLLSKRKPDVSAIIYTKKISKQLRLDIQKHSEQYPKITIKQFSKSHDRFLIIDEMEVYHIGASLKDLGKSWFAFSRIEMDASDILDRLP